MPTLTPKTPAGRIKRSFVQSVIGLVPAITALLNSDHLSLLRAGKYGATGVGGVLLVAIVQNFAESRGWIRSGQ